MAAVGGNQKIVRNLKVICNKRAKKNTLKRHFGKQSLFESTGRVYGSLTGTSKDGYVFDETLYN